MRFAPPKVNQSVQEEMIVPSEESIIIKITRSGALVIIHVSNGRVTWKYNCCFGGVDHADMLVKVRDRFVWTSSPTQRIE